MKRNARVRPRAARCHAKIAAAAASVTSSTVALNRRRRPPLGVDDFRVSVRRQTDCAALIVGRVAIGVVERGSRRVLAPQSSPSARVTEFEAMTRRQY